MDEVEETHSSSSRREEAQCGPGQAEQTGGHEIVSVGLDTGRRKEGGSDAGSSEQGEDRGMKVVPLVENEGRWEQRLEGEKGGEGRINDANAAGEA